MTTPADIPNCDYCGQVQGTPGGLVFSPPDDGGFVRKYHACTECFIARFIPDAAGYTIVPKAERPSVCPTCRSHNPRIAGHWNGYLTRPCPDPWHGGAE